MKLTVGHRGERGCWKGVQEALKPKPTGLRKSEVVLRGKRHGLGGCRPPWRLSWVLLL